jgi:hypothetical protein
VSIGYKNDSAVLPVCTPVFAGDTRRFCRPELFQLKPGTASLAARLSRRALRAASWRG